jgi:hypothetical protein
LSCQPRRLRVNLPSKHSSLKVILWLVCCVVVLVSVVYQFCITTCINLVPILYQSCIKACNQTCSNTCINLVSHACIKMCTNAKFHTNRHLLDTRVVCKPFRSPCVTNYMTELKKCTLLFRKASPGAFSKSGRPHKSLLPWSATTTCFVCSNTR